MDVSASTNKISGITNKTDEYNKNLIKTYNTSAKKINEYIDELETLLNEFNTNGTNSIIWIEIKIQKLVKKIYDAINALTNKINNITKQIEEWYINSIKQSKKSVIKSSMAKMGKNCNSTTAESMSDTIPTPEISSLLPKIKINMVLPEVTDAESIKSIELKKLPIL
jgi:DNA anti-recombination protein RmuC